VPDEVLRVENVAKRFGPVTALRDVTLNLRKGEVLGLIGDNGAGKSTLIKIMCGLSSMANGTCRISSRLRNMLWNTLSSSTSARSW
jgi:simple sugar transport system ATP-binding protein